MKLKHYIWKKNNYKRELTNIKWHRENVQTRPVSIIENINSNRSYFLHTQNPPPKQFPWNNVAKFGCRKQFGYNHRPISRRPAIVHHTVPIIQQRPIGTSSGGHRKSPIRLAIARLAASAVAAALAQDTIRRFVVFLYCRRIMVLAIGSVEQKQRIEQQQLSLVTRRTA